ncbi:MAG: PEP-CTERM sorting domain-containing protein [Verrucomicrobiales bacterium]
MNAIYPVGIGDALESATGSFSSESAAFGSRLVSLYDGQSGYAEIDVYAVPEPAVFSLVALGLLLLGKRRRR